MPRKPIGLRTTARGEKPKATVKVKIDGEWRQKSKRFDVGTAPKVIAAWRAEQKAMYRIVRLAPPHVDADAIATAMAREILKDPMFRQQMQTLIRHVVASLIQHDGEAAPTTTPRKDN